MFEDFGALLRRLIPHETYYAHDDWDRRTENICEEDKEVGERPCALHVDDPRLRRRVGPGRRRRALPRHVAARALHRARPLAPAPLALQGRRLASGRPLASSRHVSSTASGAAVRAARRRARRPRTRGPSRARRRCRPARRRSRPRTTRGARGRARRGPAGARAIGPARRSAPSTSHSRSGSPTSVASTGE